MTEHDAFLAAIRESPDDDSPRLMYADWLTEKGDPRGEFIRVQCEIAQMDAEDPRRPALTKRANSLQRQHARTWRATLPRLRGVGWGGFERGFLASVRLTSVPALLEVLPAVLDAAPAAEIKIRSAARGQLQKLFASPHAARIRALAVEPIWGLTLAAAEIAESPHAAGLRSLSLLRMGDGLRGTEAVAGSPHLTRLRRLLLSYGNLGDDAAVALAESTRLGSLCRLELVGNQIGPRGVEALATTKRFRLTELDLRSNPLGEAGIRALAAGAGLAELTQLRVGSYRHRPGNCDELLASPHLPRLAILELDHHTDAGWRAEVLASAPRGTGLRRLILRAARLSSDVVRQLAACPRVADLRELVLAGTHLKDAGAAALARSPFLADLRVLNLRFNQIGNKGATALARGVWRRLEVVDLAWNIIGDAGVQALVASPLGKHTSVLNLSENRYGKAGGEFLRRRRVRPWPAAVEEPA